MTELLFLYECETLEPTQLQPVADRLGLTVQAASHTYRSLARRGLVQLRDGRYRPTFSGVEWLHETLGRLAEEVRDRIARLQVVRSARAIALTDLKEGAPVSLEIRDGVLSARPGAAGPSRGTVSRSARRGALVEIGGLEGILPLEPATISVRTISEADLNDPQLPERLRRLPIGGRGLLAAEGLEAWHALRRATDLPCLRFGVGPAALEASRLGVPTTILVIERGLPRLLAEFAGTSPPPLEVRALERLGRATRSRRRRPGQRPESRA